MKKLFYCVIFINIAFSESVFGQTATQQQEIERSIREHKIQQRKFEKFKEAIQPKAISAERAALPFKTKRTREQNRRLLPSRADLEKYDSFLRQPRTGVVKIFPDIDCENNANVLRADEQCLKWIPNSAFYSFREAEHTNEFLSDLRVKDEFFVSDGILSQGILVSLGNISLENLTLNNDGMKFLIEFAPETDSKDALKQTKQIIRGVRSDKFEYRKTLPIVENATYAMRVVAYRGKFFRVFRGALFDVLAGDDRADLVVAFRVVRKSDDGSITLIWKELQRKEAPKIIFPKRDKKLKN